MSGRADDFVHHVGAGNEEMRQNEDGTQRTTTFAENELQTVRFLNILSANP